jgi:hypothetical protein
LLPLPSQFCPPLHRQAAELAEIAANALLLRTGELLELAPAVAHQLAAIFAELAPVVEETLS